MGVNARKVANRSRRGKNAKEFSESLMSYLGRKTDRTVAEYTSFKGGSGLIFRA